MSRNDPLRSPLKRVRGYGSAHDGTHHFWVQRLTAVALLPLLVWLVVSIVRLTDASHDAFVAWAASPLNSMLLLIALVALFWHSMLGVQVVIEDYVHHAGAKLVLLVGSKFAHVFLCAAAVLAALRIAFGS